MKNLKSKIKLIILSFLSTILLSSCGFIEFAGNMACTYAPDSDHCYQFIAVQSSSPEACENIKGTSFKDSGSNPPRDKCYMQIAINTGDESICNNMKEGAMSYTKDECQSSTRTKLSNTLEEKIKELDSQIEYSVGFKETEELLKRKRELEEKFRENFQKLPDSEKSKYYTKKKDEILVGVTDQDLKQQIASSYAKQRQGFGGDILKELDGLKKITDIETTAKRLDENANMLVDTVKTTLVDMVNEEINNKKEAILDEAKEKLLEEAYKRSGESMKNTLSKLEKMKETYDKGSEYYNSVNEKYEKLKQSYEKMKEIQDKLGKIEKLGKEGKLDQGKVEVLKGSILLGEGLEYATSYVPVFGSTFSTVTKETFGVVNEFATKRAIRTTSIDKCIEDPLNCDTDDITGY
ncbi:MAG: hypothetical protein PHI37_01925 [Candidatus Gracilibacteria bacterium]|nr:hypothetical protein [Candidatus Gracilibacteria bacterium]